MTSIKHIPFSVLITQKSELSSFRAEYAKETPQERRRAAEWEYDSSIATELFNAALHGKHCTIKPKWPPGFIALAIDPLFAQALLTVGSLDYQHGFITEGMQHFMSLTQLPEDETELTDIIDKAANFLIDNDDIDNALVLYSAAEQSFPRNSVYCAGSGYCLYRLKRMDEAVEKHRLAVGLDPCNYLHLNDLGYTLLEAGILDEGEKVLTDACLLAPPDYLFAKNNLQLLQERKKTAT